MREDTNKSISIIDIANKIGVSKSTVGNVLSGKAEIRQVSRETAKRVREVAKKMGYQPNFMARGLRKQKSGLISMIFNDLALSWADTILKSTEKVFRDNGYGAFIGVDRNDISIFRKEVEAIVQRRDEGVIFHTYISDPQEYSLLIENNIPIVFISDIPESLKSISQISTVTWEDSSSIMSLTEHLANVGVKKTAFIGCHHGVTSDLRRYRAYVDAIDKFGIETKPDWAQFFPKGPVYKKDAENTMRGLLEQIFKSGEEWPDALFGLNDTLAITAITVLCEMGIRCPEDVLVTGIGDITIAEYSNLTTVSEPLELMGKFAAETVLGCIRNPGESPVNNIISHNELHIRRSTQR